MKVLLVTTLFAVLSGGSAGSVAWPGARVVTAQNTLLTHSPSFGQPTVVKTVVPPQTKIFGFSTTQYINSVPSAVPIEVQPQVHYQVPQVAHFASVEHTAFFPIAGGSYYPGNVFYPPLTFAPSPGIPSVPIIPANPEQPAQYPPSFQPQQPGFPSQSPPSYPSQSPPSYPSQTDGDADTAVVDSADFPQQQSDQPQTPPQNQSQEQSPSTESPQQEQTSTPQPPTGGNIPFPSFPPQSGAPTFPSLPQFPTGSVPLFPGSGHIPSIPSYPQFPQGDGQPSFPSLPQFPQGSLPQFPQGSVPQFPQIPQFPSNPSFPQAPPSSYPGDAGGDKGLNDEDTISVDSA